MCLGRYGWYQDNRARAWVATVQGRYVEDSWGERGFLVQWDKTVAPPGCAVTIHGVFQNNGYSISDFGVTLSPADHHAVHLAKNGKISLEPIGSDAYKFVSERPGEWHYKLDFTFHCSPTTKHTHCLLYTSPSPRD